MNKALYGLIFASGVLVGAVIDYNMLKKRFEERLDKEIADIRKKNLTTPQAIYKKQKLDCDDLVDIGLDRAFQVCKDYEGFDEKHTETFSKLVDDEKAKSHCTFIDNDQFGELEGYSKQYLFLYKDGTFTDNNDTVIDHPTDILGAKNIKILIKEYGDDENVYIRNDEKKCDYEITKDPQTFEEYVSCNPYLRQATEEFDE